MYKKQNRQEITITHTFEETTTKNPTRFICVYCVEFKNSSHIRQIRMIFVCVYIHRGDLLLCRLPRRIREEEDNNKRRHGQQHCRKRKHNSNKIIQNKTLNTINVNKWEERDRRKCVKKGREKILLNEHSNYFSIHAQFFLRSFSCIFLVFVVVAAAAWLLPLYLYVAVRFCFSGTKKIFQHTTLWLVRQSRHTCSPIL